MTDTIKTVALADLNLSPLNPRQQVSDADIAALAGSIRTVGLLQDLAGIAGENGKVQVVAGGRRLRALQQIAEADGVDPAKVQVPVMVTDDEAEAQAWASTENVARTALHPADEVRAYRDMTRTGATPEKIASAFGVTVRHVKGRLRLAK
ncbi:MAG: ParB/Srx family N-terminal domain-containing protein, partial [Pseudomonadota bacterium]